MSNIVIGPGGELDCADVARWLGEAIRADSRCHTIEYVTCPNGPFRSSPAAGEAARAGDDGVLERELVQHVGGRQVDARGFMHTRRLLGKPPPAPA